MARCSYCDYETGIGSLYLDSMPVPRHPRPVMYRNEVEKYVCQVCWEEATPDVRDEDFEPAPPELENMIEGIAPLLEDEWDGELEDGRRMEDDFE